VGFAPVPLEPLPFASIVVSSDNDPYVALDRAREYAAAWGSTLHVLPGAGHINAASGHGPWPEGFALLDSLRAH
jgi:predicted alpha/beta hydrolase family esterase